MRPLALLLTTFLSVQTAAADPFGDERSEPRAVAPAPAEPAAKPPAPDKEWYGWKILLVDGLALAIGFVALTEALNAGSAFGSFESEPGDYTRAHALTVAAGLVFALGPAIVHYREGRAERGLASIGMRVALPSGLAAIGYADGDFDGGLVAVGVIAAMVVDDALLAWKPSSSLTATAAPLPGGVALRLSGSF